MEFSSRQKQIIDASIELIARRGIQELTIRNLSEMVGISEPAIYRHFASKTEILLALLGFFGEQSEKTFKEIASRKASALNKLQAVFEHHFRYFGENSSFSAVLFSEEIFRNDSALSSKMFQIMQGARSHVLGFVREGQMSGQVREDIPADQLSLILIGALRLLVTQWRLSGFSFELVEEGGRLWEALLALLRV
ncbi:MAG: TetR/AcrR family transcriptional regulator [Spirochaetales bacterium]|nr:TetR/AcrR family transcriptional regulator [Spirochaetales bacterium]